MQRGFRIILGLLLLSLFIGLSGCSRLSALKDSFMSHDDSAAFKGISEQQLYDRGELALFNGDYGTAVKYFESVQSQYPFGRYTRQSLLNLIYAHYKNDEFDAASAVAARYIHVYPRSAGVDYAYYMRGISEFETQLGFITRHLPLDRSLRDSSTRLKSYANFDKLVRLYPKSPYAADARQRMVYLRNLFARRELFIALYYYQKKQYVAAANRASYLIEHYSQAPQVERALVVLIDSKRALGLRQAADQALAVLKANYPDSTAAVS